MPEEMKEYIVVLHDASHKDAFVDQMTSTTGTDAIPSREIDCANIRNSNTRQAHFLVTDDEAAQLAADPRVSSIEVHHRHHPNLDLRRTASQSSLFDGTTSIDASHKNWGLLRATAKVNPFSASKSVNGTYGYNLAGNGVDIVVIDTGIAQGHPELAVNADGSGGSRVVDYDWTTLGVSGIVPLSGGSGIKGFLGDCDGHGTNCATIAAGNTCGWARSAMIYSIRAIPGNDVDIVTGNPLSSFHDIFLVFDLVKEFHLAKPIDPLTGYKRPTICTNSWTFYNAYSGMVSTNYRGVMHSTPTYTSAYGQVYPYHNATVSSIDSSIIDCMAAGVTVVAAAGNYRHKSDLPSGTDYNNYWTDGIDVYYYQRGGTPAGASGNVGGTDYRVISVGALNTSGISQEEKATFSQCGPGVDLYSPGVMIMGAYANRAYATSAVADPRLSGYYLNKISGTSQATPQIAGMLSCVAGLRPWMDHNSSRNWIVANCTPSLLYDNTVDPPVWTDYRSLQGSSNKIVYLPYNSAESFNAKKMFSGTMTYQMF